MAKGGAIGKLGKIKCMIKRWHAAAANHHHGNPPRPVGAPAPPEGVTAPAAVAPDDGVPLGLHPVYVGKSRRRYLVSSHLVDHPLFRVLVQRSGGGGGGGEEEDGADGPSTVVGCEVVLFEHLLWMLENADPQSESLDELIEFYAC